MFPDKNNQLDFPSITLLCQQGRYDNPKGSSVGFLALFRDLEHMVANGKQFNDTNRLFQPWRFVDMMEKTLISLKKSLSVKHGLTGLMGSVAMDEDEITTKSK